MRDPAATSTSSNLELLRKSAIFQQLRQVVQQQPGMLEPILQQIAEGNPQLALLIGEKQDEFLQLLAEIRPRWTHLTSCRTNMQRRTLAPPWSAKHVSRNQSNLTRSLPG
jgi:hypothetical protein